jgi:hypothetical protein
MEGKTQGPSNCPLDSFVICFQNTEYIDQDSKLLLVAEKIFTQSSKITDSDLYDQVKMHSVIILGKPSKAKQNKQKTIINQENTSKLKQNNNNQKNPCKLSKDHL